MELNKIYLGNSEILITQLEDKSIDAIITDPPYLYLNHKLDIPFDEELIFKECYRVLKDDSFLCFFGRGTSFYRWCTLCSNIGFEFVEEIIWDKNRTSTPFTTLQRIHETIVIFRKGKKILNKVHVDKIEYDMNSDNFKNIIDNARRILSDLKKLNTGADFENWLNERKVYNTKHAITTSKKIILKNSAVNQLNSIKIGKLLSSIIRVSIERYTMEHPTQKPVELINLLIKLLSNPEDVILDTFCGSGTTAEACVNLDRNFIAFEILPEYYDIAINRLNSSMKYRVLNS